MLQRIQSVYLFLVFIFALLFLILPVATLNIGDDTHVIRLWGVSQETAELLFEYNRVLGILSILLAFIVMILAIFTTFQYKKRLYQIRLGKLNILLHIMMVVSTFFYLDVLKKGWEDFFSYGAAIIFPLLSMVLILMANRAIRRDEQLIRSADRLR
ncbi:MAG: DUF4293 family protein [Bacteroidetes bacterium]|nr:MAG: DUF4293 family protein [Bacteroidota bacterium]